MDTQRNVKVPDHKFWHGEDVIPLELIDFIEKNIDKNWRSYTCNWDDVMLGAALAYIHLTKKSS